MSGKPWLPKEDALIRWLYPKKGKRPALAKLLKPRSWKAIVNRAAKLKVPRKGRLWSNAELDVLRRDFTTDNRRTLQKKLPNRPWSMICAKASELGLVPKGGIKQGYVTVEEAADRLGYSRKGVRTVFRWAGLVPLAHFGRENKYKRAHWHVVEWDAALEAHERFSQSVTLRELAEQFGVVTETVRERLLAKGVTRKGVSGSRIRIPKEDAEKFAEEWRQENAAAQLQREARRPHRSRVRGSGRPGDRGGSFAAVDHPRAPRNHLRGDTGVADRAHQGDLRRGAQVPRRRTVG